MFLMLMFFNLTDLMAFLVLPSSLPLQSSFPPLGLIFLYLWTCFSLSSVSDSEPLLLRRISISSLSLHQRKGFRLILGTLDKRVGGGWNGEHQREVAWAGAAATVIPCEGYIFTSKPSRVGGLQSQLKRNWFGFKQPYCVYNLPVSNRWVHKPGAFYPFSLFFYLQKCPCSLEHASLIMSDSKIRAAQSRIFNWFELKTSKLRIFTVWNRVFLL